MRLDGVSIGDSTRINRNCCLDVWAGLVTRDNVSVTPEVMILTAARRVADPGNRGRGETAVNEDHVCGGSRADATFGRGSVVAAGAVNN